MADISKITLPSGTTYDIKDATARQAIASLNSFDYAICTEASNTPYGVTFDNVTGTLAASTDTMGKIYLVPSTNGTNDIYDEYITINTTGTTYIWEMFGNTDVNLSDLGALAFKDSASGTFTPAGSVSTPTITVTPTTTTKYVASSADGGGSVSAGTAASCTLPALTMTVTNETLTFEWSAGTFTANTPTSVILPSFSEQTIATGIDSASATQPTFTGTASTVMVE